MLEGAKYPGGSRVSYFSFFSSLGKSRNFPLFLPSKIELFQAAVQLIGIFQLLIIFSCFYFERFWLSGRTLYFKHQVVPWLDVYFACKATRKKFFNYLSCFSRKALLRTFYQIFLKNDLSLPLFQKWKVSSKIKIGDLLSFSTDFLMLLKHWIDTGDSTRKQ